MLLDPFAQQVGIGGAVAIILVATVLKFLPAFMTALRQTRNGNNKKGTSGEKDPSYWTTEFGRILEEKLKAHDSMRNEDIRKIMGQVLESTWGARNEDFRRILQDELKRNT